MTKLNPDMVVGTEQCPKCAERGQDTRKDNLIRYDDGHAHCFSCTYRIMATGHEIIVRQQRRDAQNEEEVKELPAQLPADAQKKIDVKALQWLDKYGIIRDEIIENDIRWSDFKQWLIFPIREQGGSLLAWQARNFQINEQYASKWISRGNMQAIMHVLGFKKHPDSPLVVVEDVVSAIKVARHSRALCVFGSQIQVRQFLRMKYLTKEIILWLDGDKYVESLAFSKKAKLVTGLPTRVIFTSRDPKDHSDDEIKNILKS